jgi:hypothetical protein
MLEAILVKENIVHLGAALYLAGFLFRDQVMLRAFVAGGDLVYVLYFYLAPHVPLWGGVIWSAVLVVVNAWMIFRILADRRVHAMSEDEQRLFALLDGLTPGEFRQLMKAGDWQSAASPTTITEENQPLDRLYYVLDGDVAIEKAGSRFMIGPETFVGEVAFLLKRPASARVTLGAGSRYVVWEIAALRRLMLRAPSLAIAVAGALNKDMAAKVARA